MSDQRPPINKVPLIAAALWLAIPVAWSIATILDRTRVWEGSPSQAWMIGWMALVGAGVLTLWTILRSIDRRQMSTGAVVGAYVSYGFGLVVSVGAGWALPVWMTLYGVSLLLFARGVGSLRRAFQFVGGAMLFGVASQVVLTLLKLGTPDSFGDYPIAWTVSSIVATVGAAAGLYAISRAISWHGAVPADDQSLIPA